jgi:histidinol-phosphatase (PHP family)
VIVDYHMHLRDSDEQIAHNADAVEPFVETARAAGVDEIGLTEHVYYFTQTRSLWTDPYQIDRCSYDLDTYVEAVLTAKQRGLPVKLGLEVDYVRCREDETREILSPYPWDFLLGSVHYVDGLAIDSEPRVSSVLGVERAWEIYFEELAAAARSGLFDSLSHPDLVKVFGEHVDDFDYGPVADAIAESGVAVEVSTAGLRKPVGELYPDPRFLSECKRRDIPVTTASDAHVPELVGRDFDRARELLRGAGYTTITVFERRVGRQVAFDD